MNINIGRPKIGLSQDGWLLRWATKSEEPNLFCYAVLVATSEWLASANRRLPDWIDVLLGTVSALVVIAIFVDMAIITVTLGWIFLALAVAIVTSIAAVASALAIILCFAAKHLCPVKIRVIGASQ